VFVGAPTGATWGAPAGARSPLPGLGARGTGLGLSLLVFALSRLRWRKIAADDLTQVLLTFGILLVFADFARSRWGGVPHSLDAPGFLSGSWAIGDGSFPVYRLFMAGAALVVALGLWWLQDRTTFGALVRAGVADREMLEATGVSPLPLFAGVFLVSGLLAGLAAGLGAPVLGASMGQEFTILVLAFVVVVLGGAGSLKGAFAASLAVGIADALGKAFIPTFAEFTMMGLVVVVLAWRPAGLFGWAER
jgi:branched-chain amino acid transport system permease protein